MRTKKVVSAMTAAAMAISAFAAITVTASAAESEELLNIGYQQYVNYQDKVTAYNDDSATIGYEDWGITGAYTSSWSSTNGIKIDVTDIVAGKSGTFEVSTDFTCWAWGDDDPIQDYRKVKVFFEADGESTTIALGPTNLSDVASNTATVSGSTEYTAPDSTVYLCITQPSGSHQYKNITLTYTPYDEEEPETDETDETDETTKTVTQLFGNEIYQEGNFTIYDDSNTDGSISSVWSNYGLQAEMGNSWNSSNGVKTDITDYIAGYSGSEFAVTVNATNWAWSGTSGVNKLHIFFKVVSTDGTERTVDIASGPDSIDDVDSNAAEVSGSAVLEFEDTDTVYLCFTHGAGTQQYKTISFSVITEPEETEEPEEPQLPTEKTFTVDTSAGEDINGTGRYENETSSYFVATITTDGNAYNKMAVKVTVKEAVNGNTEASTEKEITTISGEASYVIGIVVNTNKDNIDNLTVSLK
jgi:hypothetical protein